MIFNRERGITRESPKADVLALEPTAYLQTNYEINGQQMFFICLGDRTLARGISARRAWAIALKKLLSEKQT